MFLSADWSCLSAQNCLPECYSPLEFRNTSLPLHKARWTGSIPLCSLCSPASFSRTSGECRGWGMLGSFRKAMGKHHGCKVPAGFRDAVGECHVCHMCTHHRLGQENDVTDCPCQPQPGSGWSLWLPTLCGLSKAVGQFWDCLLFSVQVRQWEGSYSIMFTWASRYMEFVCANGIL